MTLSLTGVITQAGYAGIMVALLFMSGTILLSTGILGFYLGSLGGPAARLAQDCITKVEVLEYAELGMEAVWKIEVRDFPAFIVVDDKGNDFFDEVNATLGTPIALR